MKFKVFGKEIQVINKKEDGECGSYSYKTEKITIDPNIKGKEKNITLCHELFHAMCHRLGIHNTSLHPDIEEILADNFAVLLNENADIKWKRHK